MGMKVFTNAVSFGGSKIAIDKWGVFMRKTRDSESLMHDKYMLY